MLKECSFIGVVVGNIAHPLKSGQPNFNLAEETWVHTTDKRIGLSEVIIHYIRSHTLKGGDLKTQQMRLLDFVILDVTLCF